jgi:drug/metabolite transporter (DMT)-like permease
VTAAALSLVLAAAFVHASWNLLAKRAGTGGVGFVWLFGAISSVVYTPVALVVLFVARPHLGVVAIAFMCGSGLLHMCYFTLLQRGYMHGDLSLVYPIARGTGPMLSTIAAIAVLGERPGPVALAGGALVCGGVLLLGAHGARASVTPALFGLATGAIIAVYTLWDKHAVGTLAVPPILLDWGSNLTRMVALTPFALTRRAAVREVWTNHRNEAAGVAVLAPLAYILVLTALAVTPVSYVAPAREVSILIGTVLGARVLAEGGLRKRAAAAGLVVVGLAGLAHG